MFHQKHELSVLVTDIWVRPNSITSIILKIARISVTSRFHQELENANVKSWNFIFLFVDFLRKFSFFKKRINRDAIAQRLFAKYINTIPKHSEDIVFSYNYVAYLLFKKATQKGLRCVLGQIDAGPKAGEINRELFKKTYGGKIAPNRDLYISYGSRWKSECAFAHLIIVNSEWSKKMLIEAGVDEQKLRVIELAYNAPIESISFNRVYPQTFDIQRPMRVLYLGSLKLLKGIQPLLEATRLLKDQPIEFYIVGSIQIDKMLLNDLPSNCKIIGPVSKQQTNDYYRTCDVMILPTFSDGFAMTQLEAQAWKMPIIATERCGKVITDKLNGRIILKNISEEIAEILKEQLQDPRKLAYFSQNAIELSEFSLETIYQKYKTVIS